MAGTPLIVMSSTGVPAPTVTLTAAEVAWLFAASKARAVNVCGPLPQSTVFHEAEYGVVVSLASNRPSTRNSTRDTPTVSDAAAAMVTVPLTVAPAAGLVIDTDGAVVSGAPLSTVTQTAADVVWLFAASNARAVNVRGPFAPVVHEAEYGDVESLDSNTSSTKKSTRVTPTLSEAVAETVRLPLTVVPAAGLVIGTDGGVVSGAAVPW